MRESFSLHGFTSLPRSSWACLPRTAAHSTRYPRSSSEELFRRAQLESPFSASEFSAEPGDVNDEVRILSIKFPAPSEQGLCHRAICFFDKTFTKLAYYTLEKGMDLEGSFPVLGFFDEKGEHSSYGIVSPDKDEQFVQCVEIYMGKFYEKQAD